MATVKFSITHNTPSDWAKALTAAVAAGSATYATVQSNGVTPLEWLGVIFSAGVAFATALGFYSQKDVSEAPDDVEPSTQDDVPSTEADVRIDGSVVETTPEETT